MPYFKFLPNEVNFLICLINSEKDPVAIIKWKEIYELLETVLDVCEDVSNIVVSIFVKQG